MITAILKGEGGERVIVLGVTRENIERLTDGQPLWITPTHHPGFPPDLRILILFGEAEGDLMEAVKPLTDSKTRYVAMGKPKPGSH